MISEPNYWRVKYLQSTGTFDQYNQATKTVDSLYDLNLIFYSVARDKILQVTPLFVTEYKHPILTKSEIDDCYVDMQKTQEIKKWNEHLIRGQEMIQCATEKLEKLQN